MFKNYKKLSMLLFVSIFLFSSVEANWITKKSDKKLKRPDAQPTRHTSIQKAKGLSLADSILMKQQEMQKKRMAKAKERSNENDGVHANIPNSKTTMESGSLFGVKLRKLNRSTEQNRTDAIV